MPGIPSKLVLTPIEYGMLFDRGKMIQTTVAGRTYYILPTKPTQEQPNPSYYISEHMGPGGWTELPPGDYQGLSEEGLVAAIIVHFLDTREGITAALAPVEA